MALQRKKTVIGMIPARMGSTRFPGKPLVNILGLPMVEHVRRRVSLSPLVSEVIVATCDEEIFKCVQNHGGRAIMTAGTHERCTDRIAEAAISVDAHVIVNIQGDEPLVHPDMLEPLVAPLLHRGGPVCTNLMAEIRNLRELGDRNVVKTVCDLEGNALYFSREPIPSHKDGKGKPFRRFKQLGIIAFRKEFLLEFSKLPATPLETMESVDMLRALEHGYTIRMVESTSDTVSVDTPQDLDRVQEIMRNDPLLQEYL